jgi:hypothetical protein
MIEYPKIILSSNDKNIRFGVLPVRADLEGLKREGKLASGEATRPSNARPNYYLERQFSDIFWKRTQTKNDLVSLAVGGGQNAALGGPTSLAEAFQTLNEVSNCGAHIDSYNKMSKPILSGGARSGDGFSSRVLKSIIYLKEAYLNNNKKSVILGDRVLIRDKFLIDTKTKKIVKETRYNGILAQDFPKSLAANKVSFAPTNNHMVAGGPLFQSNLFAGVSKTDKEAYLNTIKKIFKDDLQKLKMNPSLDSQELAKREKEQEEYLLNLGNNISYNSGSRISSIMSSDFSDFVTSTLNPKEPYYKGKKNSILGEQIKFGKKLTVYWPVVFVGIATASSLSDGGKYAVPGGVLIDGALVPMYTSPLGRAECFYPYPDNYGYVNGESKTAFNEQYAPTPVYSTKSVVAGYTVAKTTV